MTKGRESQDLTDLEFEFTARDSPQFNAKVERKFAVLWGRMRALFNAARIPQKMKDKLWGEVAMTATDIENLLVSKNQTKPSYERFFDRELPKAKHMRQVGEVAVIKVTKKVQPKLQNRGIPAIYLGRARDHAADTHRFLNLGTGLVIISRDVIWLNKVNGDYAGIKEIKQEMIGWIPGKHKPGRVAPAAGPPGANEPAPPTIAQIGLGSPRSTRSTGLQPLDATEIEPNAKTVCTLEQLGGVSWNQEADQLAQVMQKAMEPDRANIVIDALSLINQFQLDPGVLANDMALVVRHDVDYTKIDPSKYKEMFDAPTSFDEAWNHPCEFQRAKWREAINMEFHKMDSNKVWKKIKRSMMPTDRRCVKCNWVFDWKRSGVARAKLVACGYSQIAGVDFSNVFSPVCNDVSFRIVIIFMIVFGLDALIFDVMTAFLNGDLEEEIYMDCPEGLEQEDDECLLLLKTIYGLVQSSRQCHAKFSGILKKIGFQQCRSDPCLFYRKDETGICVVLTYVDDNLWVGNPLALRKVCKQVVEEGLEITIEKELTDYLSCEIKFDKDRTKAWIGQPHMVKKIETMFGEEVSKKQVYRTPGTPGLGLVKVQNEEEKVSPEKHSRYRTGVGMLLYLIKHSRPDMANAVRELSKVLDGPNKSAYKEMLRASKYVLDTKGRGLGIHPVMRDVLKWIRIVYLDSDWSRDKDDRKSVGGFLLFVNGVLVAWRSKKQKVASLSSSEAEFYALAEAVKEIPFFIQVLAFLGVPVETPVTVYVDNIGAIFLSKNPSSSSRSCHMSMRYFHVMDLQNDKVIIVKFIGSAENLTTSQLRMYRCKYTSSISIR